MIFHDSRALQKYIIEHSDEELRCALLIKSKYNKQTYYFCKNGLLVYNQSKRKIDRVKITGSIPVELQALLERSGYARKVQG